jgi:chromosome segregation ATPase
VRKLQRKLRDCYAALASSRERNQKLANEIFEGRLARDRVGRELDEVREAMLREAVRAGKESREHLEHLEQIAAQRMEIDQLNAAVTSLKATVGDEQRAAAKAVAEAKWLEGQLAKANTAAAIISGALRVAVERVDEQRAQIEEIRAHGRQ